MKKLLCLLGVLAFAWPGVLPAQDRAAELVAGLAAELRALNGYEVEFEVAAGEYRAQGAYTVCGDSYHLRMGDAEVFGAGVERFKISHGRREIVVGTVDAAGRNILDNPVHAFDFLCRDYAPSLLWERDGEAAVALAPLAGSASPAGGIELTVSVAPLRPRSVVYDFDGERIEVHIFRFAPAGGPLAAFDRTAYADYEWIDFR